METKEDEHGKPGGEAPATENHEPPPTESNNLLENLGTIADAHSEPTVAQHGESTGSMPPPEAAAESNTGIPEIDAAAAAAEAATEPPVSIPVAPAALPSSPAPASQEEGSTTDPAAAAAAAPTAGAEKEEEFPVFLVVPSTFSYIFSIFLILLMFLIYILSIGSIASFEGKFFPNVYMFWDFITTGNTTQYQTEFESYMKNVLVTTQNDMNNVNGAAAADSFVGSRSSQEGFANYLGVSLGGGWLDRAWNSWSWFLREVQIMWNRLLLNIMVRGNTIHVVR
jgi:hypothetical protein